MDVTNLTGQFLIAMPGMTDPRFDRTVVYICAHSEEDGALGLIINKPSSDINFSDLLEQLEIGHFAPGQDVDIHIGGPVESGRGFVLHSPEYTCDGTQIMDDSSLGLTSTLDILEDIAAGRGPQKTLMALGYAGWAPGQLEDEIAGNGWLTGQANRQIIFDHADEDKWQAAMTHIGVSPLLLSDVAGHA